MTRHHLSAIGLAIGLAALVACERKEPGAQRPSTYRDQSREQATAPREGFADQEFADSAARANLAEIEAGRLAASSGSDPAVKSFGQQMITDHSAARSKLGDLAAKKGIRLPTEPDESQKQEAAKLRQFSGADFDQKYAAMMVSDHEKAVALFDQASRGAKDGDLRDFAKNTLPTLQHHLKMARDLKSKVGESTAD